MKRSSLKEISVSAAVIHRELQTGNLDLSTTNLSVGQNKQARLNYSNAEQIFATQRGYGEWSGWWEFPGGKIEAGESPEQALIREIKEELAAKIIIEQKVKTVEYDYPAFHLTMHCFWCSLAADSELVLKEHKASRWLCKKDLYSVKWLPADKEVLPQCFAKLISAL